MIGPIFTPSSWEPTSPTDCSRPSWKRVILMGEGLIGSAPGEPAMAKKGTLWISLGQLKIDNSPDVGTVLSIYQFQYISMDNCFRGIPPVNSQD